MERAVVELVVEAMAGGKVAVGTEGVMEVVAREAEMAAVLVAAVMVVVKAVATAAATAAEETGGEVQAVVRVVEVVEQFQEAMAEETVAVGRVAAGMAAVEKAVAPVVVEEVEKVVAARVEEEMVVGTAVATVVAEGVAKGEEVTGEAVRVVVRVVAMEVVAMAVAMEVVARAVARAAAAGVAVGTVAMGAAATAHSLGGMEAVRVQGRQSQKNANQHCRKHHRCRVHPIVARMHLVTTAGVVGKWCCLCQSWSFRHQSSPCLQIGRSRRAPLPLGGRQGWLTPVRFDTHTRTRTQREDVHRWRTCPKLCMADMLEAEHDGCEKLCMMDVRSCA